MCAIQWVYPRTCMEAHGQLCDQPTLQTFECQTQGYADSPSQKIPLEETLQQSIVHHHAPTISLLHNSKTLICCTSFPKLGFSEDICPKTTVSYLLCVC